MKARLALAMLLLPALSAAPARALEPFVASYQVFHDGHELGNATLQLVHSGGDRWRVDLEMKGSGLMRLTGLNAQQSTVFDTGGGDFRPLSQSRVRRVFLSHRKSTGVYDWGSRTARWQGDVKPQRRGPVALQPGDMSSLLLDLAAIRDAAPGKTLRYRLVDDGRARTQTYAVAPQPETIQVGELSYDALRVARVDGGNDETILWVADGVPTPVRLLQREDGEDTTDLRLVEYKGVQ